MPVLLTALAASGFQRITYEADPEYLFSPINGHSKLERQALEKHFPMNYSEFDAGQNKQDITKKSLLPPRIRLSFNLEGFYLIFLQIILVL